MILEVDVTDVIVSVVTCVGVVAVAYLQFRQRRPIRQINHAVNHREEGHHNTLAENARDTYYLVSRLHDRVETISRFQDRIATELGLPAIRDGNPDRDVRADVDSESSGMDSPSEIPGPSDGHHN
jgi:hypothetical protein